MFPIGPVHLAIQEATGLDDVTVTAAVTAVALKLKELGYQVVNEELVQEAEAAIDELDQRRITDEENRSRMR